MLFRGYSDAGVPDAAAQRHRPLGLRHGFDPQLDLAGIGELDCIADQIQDHLPNTNRIADYPVRNVRQYGGDQLEAFLVRPRGDGLECARHALVQREWQRLEPETTGVDLRVIQDVVQQREQGVRRVLDHRQVFALLRVQPGIEREFRHADDPVHRRSDLMTHVGDEFAFCARRRLRLGHRELERLRAIGNPAFQLAAMLFDLAAVSRQAMVHAPERAKQAADVALRADLSGRNEFALRNAICDQDGLSERSGQADDHSSNEYDRQHQRGEHRGRHDP